MNVSIERLKNGKARVNFVYLKEKQRTGYIYADNITMLMAKVREIYPLASVTNKTKEEVVSITNDGQLWKRIIIDKQYIVNGLGT